MGAKKLKRQPVLVSDLKKEAAPKLKKTPKKRKLDPSASTAYRFVSPTHGEVKPRVPAARISVVKVVKKRSV